MLHYNWERVYGVRKLARCIRCHKMFEYQYRTTLCRNCKDVYDMYAEREENDKEYAKRMEQKDRKFGGKA